MCSATRWYTFEIAYTREGIGSTQKTKERVNKNTRVTCARLHDGRHLRHDKHSGICGTHKNETVLPRNTRATCARDQVHDGAPLEIRYTQRDLTHTETKDTKLRRGTQTCAKQETRKQKAEQRHINCGVHKATTGAAHVMWGTTFAKNPCACQGEERT